MAGSDFVRGLSNAMMKRAHRVYMARLRCLGRSSMYSSRMNKRWMLVPLGWVCSVADEVVVDFLAGEADSRYCFAVQVLEP